MAPGKNRCGFESTRSCGTKTWNVIQFNLIKGTGLVVDALFPLFRAARGPGM